MQKILLFLPHKQALIVSSSLRALSYYSALTCTHQPLFLLLQVTLSCSPAILIKASRCCQSVKFFQTPGFYFFSNFRNADAHVFVLPTNIVNWAILGHLFNILYRAQELLF